MDQEPFFTEWFDPENHFERDIEMTVFDFKTKKYTVDGSNWLKINEDHL